LVLVEQDHRKLRALGGTGGRAELTDPSAERHLVGEVDHTAFGLAPAIGLTRHSSSSRFSVVVRTLHQRLVGAGEGS
jgi:hypothetical protein